MKAASLCKQLELLPFAHLRAAFKSRRPSPFFAFPPDHNLSLQQIFFCSPSLHVSFMPSFLLVLLLDGQLAAQTGSSGCRPGRFLVCGARPWKAKLMPYFVTYTGGGGKRPPDVTVRLNVDKPEVGKPNVSTREELAGCCFSCLFCLLQHLKKKSIVCHVSVHLGLRQPFAKPVASFLFLLSLSSPRALCCFTQTDFGQRDPRTSVCHAL